MPDYVGQGLNIIGCQFQPLMKINSKVLRYVHLQKWMHIQIAFRIIPIWCTTMIYYTTM